LVKDRAALSMICDKRQEDNVGGSMVELNMTMRLYRPEMELRLIKIFRFRPTGKALEEIKVVNVAGVCSRKE
jgi:hypothetical protein